MAEGQYLGQRNKFIYQDDNDNSYLIVLDETLGSLTETGLTLATTANATGLTELPKSLKPRYVNWQGICDGNLVRKRLVCSRTSTVYSAGVSTSFDIDGSTGGAVTSRVGEKQLFLKLDEPATP